MKTKVLTPVERDQMYKHQEVISNRMQWLAIVTILTAIAVLACCLDLKDGLLIM